jgi:putative heme iron utilization protein
VASRFDYSAELNRGSLAGPDMSDAELARELVARSRLATLATLGLRPAEYPYASLVAHASDERGRPVFLLSALAEHTKNLVECARASLLVFEQGSTSIVHAPRVTLVGTCQPVDESEREALRSLYVAAHPESSTFSADELHAYALYRLEPVDCRVIVGFGRLSWVSPKEYAAARTKV